METLVYTSQEVADMFRVDVRTVHKWVKQGKIPTVNLPHTDYRYPAAQIDAMLRGEDTPDD